MAFKTGQVNVTTSGIPVQLPAIGIEGEEVLVVKAKKSNGGTITVGYSSATALNTGSDHFKLEANESVKIRVDEGTEVWIDATVSGEGIEWIVEV